MQMLDRIYNLICWRLIKIVMYLLLASSRLGITQPTAAIILNNKSMQMRGDNGWWRSIITTRFSWRSCNRLRLENLAADQLVNEFSSISNVLGVCLFWEGQVCVFLIYQFLLLGSGPNMAVTDTENWSLTPERALEDWRLRLRMAAGAQIVQY